MKSSALLGMALIVSALPGLTWAQQRRRNEAAFPRARPAVGEALPNVIVYDLDGKEVTTSSLRGHYTVLVFGCLT